MYQDDQTAILRGTEMIPQWILMAPYFQSQPHVGWWWIVCIQQKTRREGHPQRLGSCYLVSAF